MQQGTVQTDATCNKWQRKTKRQEKVKNGSLGVLVLMTGLWPGLKDILNWRQNCSKNKQVSENAVTRRYKKCSLRVMGSWLQRIIIRSVQFTYPSQRLTIPSLAQMQNIFFYLCPTPISNLACRSVNTPTALRYNKLEFSLQVAVCYWPKKLHSQVLIIFSWTL